MISSTFVGVDWRAAFLSDDWNFYNNTFYASFEFLSAASIGGDDDPQINLKSKNNIFQNTSSSNNDFAIDIITQGGTINAIGDWDFNIFEGNAGDGNWFRFNGTAGSTIAAWIDSVDNYDADGATNSLNGDPSLQSVTTTCFILDTSNAFEAGTDLGYGDDIGYFQLPAASGRRRLIRIY